jgi:hypothetical protein
VARPSSILDLASDLVTAITDVSELDGLFVERDWWRKGETQTWRS